MAFTTAKYESRRCSNGITDDFILLEKDEQRFSENSDMKFDKRLAMIHSKYRNILDASYHLLLSESSDLEKLIQFAPGFIVLWYLLPIPDVAKLLDIDETSFLGLIERNRHFVAFKESRDHTFPSVMPNSHLCKFLSDRNRSL